ncbi:MAG: glycine cleavage system protein H [Candidatus Schekmanbacteria bacterium RBG_16_38_10]|uniref:Glycine cleavage system H protein n=1 Tax=Candidatus Schekmanbacteria bacterium RBG_16_38_10 TaxID=1817879 RepID=A0A1F7RRR3_9BACT|nr:MAG: glycine cleavage system protein H [Candidatus Schekmanbacteria bacterium RBG_16_38_10]
MRPRDLKYSETHEWVKLVGKDVVVGITDYAVKQLSDLVHIELPKVGEKIEQGSSFGEIESVKTVAELIAPIGGKVIEVNKSVVDNIEILSDEPFEEGWLMKVKVGDMSELDTLMSSSEYADFIKLEKEDGEDGSSDDDVDEDDFV